MDGLELATWILALATIGYAIAAMMLFWTTREYAKDTKKLVEENKKERLQPIVSHILDEVLPKLTENLGKETSSDRYDFRSQPNWEIFKTIDPEATTLFENQRQRLFMGRLLKKHPDILTLAKEHNVLVGKLKEQYERLFGVLSTDEFKVSIQNAINEYNRIADKKIEYPPEGYAIDMINCYPKVLPYGDKGVESCYRINEELLKQYWMRTEVQQEVKKRDDLYSELKENAGKLVNELGKIEEEIVEEYLSSNPR